MLVRAEMALHLRNPNKRCHLMPVDIRTLHNASKCQALLHSLNDKFSDANSNELCSVSVNNHWTTLKTLVQDLISSELGSN